MTQFSSYQTAVINTISSGLTHLVVDAKAGSGKSFTILAAIETLAANGGLQGGTLLMAFNKNIADELVDKARAKHIPVGGFNGVTIKTFHSLGFAAWMRYMGRGTKIHVEQNKSWKLLQKAVEEGHISEDTMKSYGATACKLVAFAKNAGVGCVIDGVRIQATPDVFEELFAHHNMQLQNDDCKLQDAITLAIQLLRQSAKVKTIVDFDDMLWLPVVYGANFFQNRRVFVDELQDTNALQLEIAIRSLKPGNKGQFVGVGDPHQAIYGFRGADSDAFNNVIDRFSAKVLPLSICYRCSAAVIREAQRLCPDIEASPTAVEGSVRDLSRYTVDFFAETADLAVLCRNNAPLIALAYSLIGRGVAAHVLGREIGEGLQKLIDKMNATNIDMLIERFEAYFSRETKKAEKKGRNRRVATLDDQQTCLEVFINNLTETNRSIAGLKRQISRIFDEDAAGVTLSSIHKAKGREWENVAILDSHLMPSPFAKKPWQASQEKNLEYVAITRAKVNLVYISSDDWAE